MLQARWLAEGQLSVATPPLREFFSVLNLVDLGDRTFAQFPIGGPAMLMLGSLVGAEWLVGPLAGAVSVLAFATGARCRRTDRGRAVGIAEHSLFCSWWRRSGQCSCSART